MSAPYVLALLAAMAFALGSTQAQEILGYGSVTPTRIKQEILELLPKGPPLDVGAGQSSAPQPPTKGALGAGHRAPAVG